MSVRIQLKAFLDHPRPGFSTEPLAPLSFSAGFTFNTALPLMLVVVHGVGKFPMVWCLGRTEDGEVAGSKSGFLQHHA